MSSTGQRLSDYHSVDEALADLCGDLVSAGGPVSRCVAVQPSELPRPAAELLVHHDHMTTRLEQHHEQRIELRVLRERLDGDLYRRTIVLRGAESGEVVEFGIVRIDLAFTSTEVRREILDQAAPLGDILIRHDVLRRIEPRWYLRFPSDCSLLAEFDQTTGTETFGRVGTIYCNEQPAIELLEVVTRWRPGTGDVGNRGS